MQIKNSPPRASDDKSDRDKTLARPMTSTDDNNNRLGDH